MKYLVYRIGCIECGVSSYPIKTTDNLDEAKLIADQHPDPWEPGGGYVTIIDLEKLESIEREA